MTACRCPDPRIATV